MGQGGGRGGWVLGRWGRRMLGFGSKWGLGWLGARKVGAGVLGFASRGGHEVSQGR